MILSMTDNQPLTPTPHNPIILQWADDDRDLGDALEALAKSATEAELANLVYAIGHMALKIANTENPHPKSIWSVGVAGAVLGNELANRYGFDQDLLPAWAATLNRQITDA